jgi:hypothetical protein
MVGSDDVVVVERRRRSGLRVLLGLLVVAVLAVVVVLVVLATKESSSAKDDVSITTCRPAAGGGKPTAAGKIANPTSKDSNYTIRLNFVDSAGNTVSQGATSVRDVAAGGTATWELTGVRSADGQVHCELSGVSRTHLPGQ